MVKIISGLIAKYYLKKPDQAALLAIKFPTIKSILEAGLNELHYLWNSSKSYKLTSINLEVTNNCNLKCSICLVSYGMKREKGMIDFALFKKIIDDNPQLEFILLFQWGEPLLHPKICEMIKYAKERKIRTMLTTNGTLLDDGLTNRIIKSGLDRITFSVDGINQTYEKIRGFDYLQLEKIVKRFKRIKETLNSPIKIDISMVVTRETEQDVAAYLSRWQREVDRVQLIPQLDYSNSTRKKKCRELWRGAMVVLWDGRVVPCCADYDAQMVIGDAKRESLRKIWNGERIICLRQSHNRGNFFGLCKTCGEYKNIYVSPRFS